MKRIISQVNFLMPLSKAGLDLLAGQAAWPCCRSRSARRWPQRRPWPRRFPRWCPGSTGWSVPGGHAAAQVARVRIFSTGRDSPVSVAWMTNRSLADRSAHVAGNHVAGGELDDVARARAVARGSSRGLSVADDRGRDADHGLELGGGGIGPGLLHEAQGHAQDDHQQHHRAGPEVAGSVGEDCQDGKQDDERVAGRYIHAR